MFDQLSILDFPSYEITANNKQKEKKIELLIKNLKYLNRHTVI